jgi:hypothetical protein
LAHQANRALAIREKALGPNHADFLARPRTFVAKTHAFVAASGCQRIICSATEEAGCQLVC